MKKGPEWLPVFSNIASWVNDAWMAMAKEADETNTAIERGDPTPHRCPGRDQEEPDTRHPCSWCGTWTLCRSLVPSTVSPGLLDCPKCLDIPIVDRSPLLKYLSFHLRRDRVSTEGQTTIINAATSMLQSRLGNEEGQVTWTSASTGITRPLMGGGKDPLAPSFDAAFPVGRLPDAADKLALHTPDNLRVVELCLNFCQKLPSASRTGLDWKVRQEPSGA